MFAEKKCEEKKMNIRIKLWFQNSTAEKTICDPSQRKSSIYTWGLLCHSYEVID